MIARKHRQRNASSGENSDEEASEGDLLQVKSSSLKMSKHYIWLSKI